MPLIPKPNYNQIFASQAPEQDKPAVFNNYPLGWGVESRPNNGKPTIKGFNYLQQTSDLKDLWILQNGACLPYDESIEYAEGAPVLKDGVIQYKTADGFKSRDAVTIPTYSSAADGVDPVTGVADGAYFNVRSSSDESYIDEYQNVGGSAVATGKSYLSALGVQQQEKPASTIKDASGKNQQEINDMIGADWYEKSSGYNVGNRVSKNGFVYQSLENSNSTDPATDISKWALVNTLSVNSIAQLRKVNPVVPNSIIHLRGLTESSYLGGGEWFYDANDSTSADNGWFIVVTTSGKRLKRVGLDKEFNLDWAGVLNGADISTKWQEAINYIHNKIKAVNSLWNIPSITSSGGEFLLNNPTVKPPYVCTNFTSSVHLKADNIADSTHEAAITIYCDDTVNYYVNNRSPQFPKTLSCTGGKIQLSRSGTRALTNPIALYTKGATAAAHAINMKVSDLEVNGAFKAGHGNKAERTWLMRFEDCVFNGFYGIAYLGATNIDSGERISYVNCVASGGYNNLETKAIYIESPGININFEGSIDFTGGDVVYLASSATWANLTFINSHIESWNGYLVNFETPSSSQARFVSFKSTNFLPNGSLGIAQSLSRKLINGSGGTVLFDDGFISWTSYPYDSFNSILTDTSTGIKVRVKNHRNVDLGLHPFSARSNLLKTMNFSAEADGATITSTGATATTIRILRNQISGVTATIKALDNSLIDTSLPAGTTNVIKAVWGSSAYAYFESVEKIRVQPGREYGMKATAVMPDLDSNLRIAPAIAWYDESDTYISRSEVYYSDMKVIVNARINGVPAYGSRADKRVSCRTNPLVAPAGASYGRAAFQLTNGTTGATYYITDYNLFDSPTN